MGPLAELIQRRLDQLEISIREAAMRSEVSHQALNNILLDKVRAPHPNTVEKLSLGLGIPLQEIHKAVARNIEQSYTVEDITTTEALQIAIARIGEVPDEDLPELIRQAQEILDETRARQNRRDSESNG